MSYHQFNVDSTVTLSPFAKSSTVRFHNLTYRVPIEKCCFEVWCGGWGVAIWEHHCTVYILGSDIITFWKCWKILGPKKTWEKSETLEIMEVSCWGFMSFSLKNSGVESEFVNHIWFKSRYLKFMKSFVDCRLKLCRITMSYTTIHWKVQRIILFCLQSGQWYKLERLLDFLFKN